MDQQRAEQLVNSLKGWGYNASYYYDQQVMGYVVQAW